MRAIINQHMMADIVESKPDPNLRKAIVEAVKAGELKKLVSNIYTSSITEPPEVVVKRNLYPILGILYQGAVISHRSAIEAGPTDGNIVLTYKYAKKIKLPGITVHLIQGQGPTESDTPFVGGLFLSSPERSWLENLQRTFSHGFRRTISKEMLETQLDEFIRVYGEDQFRDRLSNARKIAPSLGLEEEMEILGQLAGGLLGTRSKTLLSTERGIARAEGLPFDSERIARFEILHKGLMTLPNLPMKLPRSSIETSSLALSNLCFFDAYFSNFIEGTRFEVEEAKAIVYEGKIPTRRPDSHDIIGTFQVLHAMASQAQPEWSSYREMIDEIKRHHKNIMKAHPDKRPGEFKTEKNFAGSTEFVAPEYVEGTIKKSFEFYKSLPPGFQRAAFVKFLVAEVHPFADGNGRLSRIVMNRELHSEKQMPIIIPTVYRIDYLDGVRKLTRSNDPKTYIKMLARAQAFTASVNYSSFETAKRSLAAAHAFSDDSNDILLF